MVFDPKRHEKVEQNVGSRSVDFKVRFLYWAIVLVHFKVRFLYGVIVPVAFKVRFLNQPILSSNI